MIFNDHDVTDFELRVESAGGVGDDDLLHAHQLHHSHRHGALAIERKLQTDIARPLSGKSHDVSIDI